MSPPRARRPPSAVAGTERKFSWATQRITELTGELDKAQKKAKVRGCCWGACARVGVLRCPVQRCGDAAAGHTRRRCRLVCCRRNSRSLGVPVSPQDLDKQLRTREDNSAQLKQLQAKVGDLQQAASQHEVRCWRRRVCTTQYCVRHANRNDVHATGVAGSVPEEHAHK
jgi:hypothetical protein